MQTHHASDFPSSPEIQVELLLFLQTQARMVACKDVYAPVAHALKLSENHVQLKVSDGKRSRWQIACQGARDRLVKLGLMNNGPWGMWSFTDAGEKKAREVRNKPDPWKDFD